MSDMKASPINQLSLQEELEILKNKLNDLFIRLSSTNPEYIEPTIYLLEKNYEEVLFNLISMKKKELIDIANTRGLEHPDTIEASERLDRLIIQFQYIKKNFIGYLYDTHNTKEPSTLGSV
ncbi:aspartyl-phosphate phosphatase Spo0E family protein [Lederbergia graminis]|uniref:Aspartyl-phosphate phosphatase Spo0E family protein n=1 Tax=Lederbergia graminis TaxID=735518 RepID=A0ABW0LM43_9BACI|nr:aspartyl-phosphate phosphatase Spo0E family protein [Paenibacillus bovis]